MHPESLRELLQELADGRTTVAAVEQRLRTLPFEDLGFARLDHHRALRCGFPEVIFGRGKTPAQIAELVERLAAGGQSVLATRVRPLAARITRQRVPAAVYDRLSRTLVVRGRAAAESGGFVAIVAAGTADLPVAEEARITCEMMDCRTERFYDVGVAGLQRLLACLPRLREAAALVVVAGMEGALPSVVGGLVRAPVIAVPTSVGYGASFQGLAALLAMLNSCAAGVSVVNIDNGFGAGYQAALIAWAADGNPDAKPARVVGEHGIDTRITDAHQ
ncbi:MAG: nickel pincer cofactor biosynthesis protein LarB [Phycisphaerae bacterium]|nr:nickel pincer cofactor biosynthesis protein LarB [Phycisphaerae bacterium]MCZ2399032.1 nickel pincer cofactor biosynthesis protein LarB [Phycisphaerae bacterium]